MGLFAAARLTLWLLANGSAALIIVLLLIDPTRDLVPIFALAILSIAFAVALHFLRKRRG